MVIGAYGFFLMFYLSGAYSVPRRYAIYPAEVAQGSTLAGIGAVFASLFLLGFLLYIVEIGRSWVRALRAPA